MVSMTGISFPIKALRAQIASAINVVIQVARHEDGRRRVVSVQEINGMEGDVVTMSELFRFERQGIDADGNVLGELRRRASCRPSTSRCRRKASTCRSCCSAGRSKPTENGDVEPTLDHSSSWSSAARCSCCRRG